MSLPLWAMVVLGLLTIHGVLALIVVGHALIHKRSPRAAMAWSAISLSVPFGGSILYFFFGINRIKTRARLLKERGPGAGHHPDYPDGFQLASSDLAPELVELARVSEGVTNWPLVAGNSVEALHNGEGAYPEMLEAIRRATSSVYLATYIFESNRTGEAFVEALSAAHRRGVDVRVMIDGVGAIHIRSDVSRQLRDLGVPTVLFLPPRLFPIPSLHINLRNHRKILVVDEAVAFTGGMNLGDRHLVEDPSTEQVADIHFRFHGPIVAQIERTFLDDWAFVCDQPASKVCRIPQRSGSAVCRAIVDGPDEFIDRLTAVLVGAVSAAHKSVHIMNPYFLPPRELVGALKAAALRGVEVVILLPGESDSFVTRWATRHMLWELLRWQVAIYYQPPPFVHTKLFVVDGEYTQIGSSNLDPRSLRLNFELNVEVFDRALADELVSHVEEVRSRSHRITLEEVDSRPLLRKLGDGLAWLFTPYL